MAKKEAKKGGEFAWAIPVSVGFLLFAVFAIVGTFDYTIHHTKVHQSVVEAQYEEYKPCGDTVTIMPSYATIHDGGSWIFFSSSSRIDTVSIIGEIRDGGWMNGPEKQWLNDTQYVKIRTILKDGYLLTTTIRSKKFDSEFSYVRGDYNYIDSIKCIEYTKAKTYADSLYAVLKEEERLLKQLNDKKCK